MSLNIIEISEIIQYIEKIEDKKIQDLLQKMQFEYQEYIKIGTPEDFKNYKVLCDIPMSQVNNFLKTSNRALIDEITELKKEIELIKQEKRGK